MKGLIKCKTHKLFLLINWFIYRCDENKYTLQYLISSCELERNKGDEGEQEVENMQVEELTEEDVRMTLGL